MGLYIDHVNSVLNKMRADTITALSTDKDSDAWKAQLAVQRAVKRVWNAKQWSFKQRSSTLTTVNGTIAYELPKDVGEPYIILSSDSPYYIIPVAVDLFDLKVPNPTTSGKPKFMTFFDQLGVSEQPSSASAITVVSSSSSDTAEIVTIKGIVSGQEDVETVTLNGTSSVATSKSFTSLIAVSKSAETVGRVTLTSNASAVTNLVFAPNEKVVRLRKTRLYPIPDAAVTVTIKHYALPPILKNLYEDIEIPDRWDYVVEQFAFAFAVQAQGQDQSQEFTNQVNLASQMLGDMELEEKVGSAQALIPLRWGEDVQTWREAWIPEGYGLAEVW